MINFFLLGLNKQCNQCKTMHIAYLSVRGYHPVGSLMMFKPDASVSLTWLILYSLQQKYNQSNSLPQFSGRRSYLHV